MVNLRPAIYSFSGGEIAPRLYGRMDIDRYQSSCKTLENFIALATGGAHRRSGFRHVSTAKDQSKEVRLVSFQFSTAQAYVLEFGDLYVRFYKDEAVIIAGSQTFDSGDVDTGNDQLDITDHFFVDEQGPFQITDGGGGLPGGLLEATNYYIRLVDTDTIELSLTPGGAAVDITTTGGAGPHTIAANGTVPAEVTTTYTEAELFELGFEQSADVLYIAHNAHDVATLSRSDHDEWVLADLAWRPGPYLPIRTQVGGGPFSDGTELTRTGDSGVETVTANNPLFESTDEGRWLFMQDEIGYGVMESFSSSTQIDVDLINAVAGNLTTEEWWLGAFGVKATIGFPAALAFHEQRFMVAASVGSPQTVWGSQSADFVNFLRQADDSSDVADDDGVSYTLASNQVNAIRWMRSTSRALLLGTSGGVWVMGSNSLLDPLTPSNVNVRINSTAGAKAMAPVLADGDVVYASVTGRQVFRMGYSIDEDRYVSRSMTLTSPHITGSGLKQMAYASEPHSIIWSCRDDGRLAAMTYVRDQQVEGWHRHTVGGVFVGDHAVVGSVTVIPSPNEDHDQLWAVVKRTINGSTTRYIEFMEDDFDEVTHDIEDAFFVDSGLSLDSAITITGATQASPVVITATAHGFSDGDTVRITHVKGMTELNGITYKVANKTANDFELTDSDDDDIDGSSFTAYLADGEVRGCVTSITGLGHLEGETVQVLGDGNRQSDQVVASGAITLSAAASEVHVGLGYVSDLVPLPFETDSRIDSAAGKKQRPARAYIRLDASMGGQFGQFRDDAFKMDDFEFMESTVVLGAAPVLYSDIQEVNLDHATEADDSVVVVRQADPWPMTVTLIATTLSLAQS